ncbi:hypothetical protein CYK37_05005 [Mesorhizobium loti]|nr:hypothetical protein [Mesorhizobium loti]PLP60497.1 hypothetical protein CYK37_05005 [Mesorhizobium loti]
MQYLPNTEKNILYICIIIIVYFFCYGPFALVTVPFWDDWVLTLHNPDSLWQLFGEIGRRDQYFMMAPFAILGSPILWAITNFICWGVVALCVYAILANIGWASGDAFWAAILTAAIPLNQARFALAVLPYSISAALFAVAILLLVLSINYRNVWLRVVAAALLTLSFTTNSFLAMAPLPLLAIFLALRRRDQQNRFWPAMRGMLSHLELFALPVIYWVSKVLLQPVYGRYSDYNQFRIGPLEGLTKSVSILVGQLPDWSVFFPTRGHLVEGGMIALVCVAVLSVLTRARRVDVRTKKLTTLSAWSHVAGLGVFVILAVFPYVMVGHSPSFEGLWETRHQTTLSVILGIFVFATLRAALPSRLVPTSCVIVLYCFTAIDVSVSRQLMADIYDSNAIMHAPRVVEIPKNTLVAVFEDNRSYRMMRRQFRFYELSSMLSAHASERTIMAMSNRDVTDPATGTFAAPGSDGLPAAIAKLCALWVRYPEYGFGDIAANGKFAELRLTPKSDPPTFLEGLGRSFDFVFNYQETIDHAAENLDVAVTIRTVGGLHCAKPVSTPPQTR